MMGSEMIYFAKLFSYLDIVVFFFLFKHTNI